MLNTITEGAGRTQPNNVLDELLPLPSKAGKETKSSAAGTGDTGVSSFEQMLTDDLQSRTRAPGQSSPTGGAKAAPQVTQVTDDKNDKTDKEPAIAPTALLTRAEEAPMSPTAAKKDAQEKEKLLPVAGETDPNMISSLLTTAPAIPGAVPATTVKTASEDRYEKLPLGDAVAELSLDKAEENITNQTTAKVTTPPGENTTNQTTAKVTTPPGENTTNQTAAKVTTPPGGNLTTQTAAKFTTTAEENITNQTAAKVTTPPGGNLTNQTAAKFTITAEENITNQIAAKVTTPPGGNLTNQTVAKFTITAEENTTNQTAAKVTTPPEGNLTNQIAAKFTTTAEENITSQTAAKVTTPPGGNLTNQTAAKFTTTTRENITNQAAAAAINAWPEKAPFDGRQTAEPPGEANGEGDAILTKNIRELLVKAGLAEYIAPNGDAKQDPVMGDKGKSHTQDPFAVPEIMDIHINTAGTPLSKGQDVAVPTASLLVQVAEQLPQAISKGSGRIRLSLEPDNLGKLDMDLVVRENRVQIILTAESRTVQLTLQGHVGQLKDALQQQGLAVDGFNVLLQDGRHGQGDPAGGGNPFWSEYNHAAADKGAMGKDNFPATIAPFVSGQNLKKGAEGINIFV